MTPTIPTHITFLLDTLGAVGVRTPDEVTADYLRWDRETIHGNAPILVNNLYESDSWGTLSAWWADGCQLDGVRGKRYRSHVALADDVAYLLSVEVPERERVRSMGVRI